MVGKQYSTGSKPSGLVMGVTVFVVAYFVAVTACDLIVMMLQGRPIDMGAALGAPIDLAAYAFQIVTQR